MDLEELTLHYYIRVFNFVLIFFLILFFFYYYYLLNKNIELIKNEFSIKKGEKIENILNYNIKNISILDKYLIKIYYKVTFINRNKFIHYGNFEVKNNSSIIDFLETIYNPSNIFTKILIVEGWSKNQLENEISKHFDKYYLIPYEDIIADTYYHNQSKNFNKFVENLNFNKKKYFESYKGHEILKKYSENEIMIIGSLIEKEGLDYQDKKKISSVIFNRLNMSMKLQIDATVLFAITNGQYNLERKLLLRDLKIEHPYNTYKVNGLPPKPISYIGKKTLDLIFENYKSDFLFYFFNKSLKRHIFSKNFDEHKRKLNEYRNKK